jgi:hypothetical protein
MTGRKKNPNHVTLWERCKYQFDRTVKGSTAILLLWLAFISALMIMIAAIFLAVGIRPDGQDHLSYAESLWKALSVALTPDAVQDVGWAYRVVMLGVALMGLLIVGAIIGVLTSGIESKLHELRRGRSRLLVEKHIIILGWSDKVGDTIAELVKANENIPRDDKPHKKPIIAVLADRDVLNMEDEVKQQVGDFQGTKCHYRRGDPCNMAALRLIRAGKARAAIVFADKGPEGNEVVLNRVLALKKVREDQKDTSFHIVAETDDKSTTEEELKKLDVLTVSPGELITRVLLQSAREPGLSFVYEELLDFEGCEIYVGNKEFPKESYEYFAIKSKMVLSPIGIYKREKSILNPQVDSDDCKSLQAKDELIYIAEDDDFNSTWWQRLSFKLPFTCGEHCPCGKEPVVKLKECWKDPDSNEQGCHRLACWSWWLPWSMSPPLSRNTESTEKIDQTSTYAEPVIDPRPLKYLVIGWHKWAEKLLEELNGFRQTELEDGPKIEGDEITIINDKLAVARSPRENLDEELKQFKVNTPECKDDDARIAEIEKWIKASGCADRARIIVLSYRDKLKPHEADSRTLLTLLRLDRLLHGLKHEDRPAVISEILDAHTRDIAPESTQANDFIASNRLVSCVMAQYAENKDLQPIIDMLLTSKGAEVHLRPATNYVPEDSQLPHTGKYGELVACGLGFGKTDDKKHTGDEKSDGNHEGETVIGIWKYRGQEMKPGVKLAIPRGEDVTLCDRDQVIVIAEK